MYIRLERLSNYENPESAYHVSKPKSELDRIHVWNVTTTTIFSDKGLKFTYTALDTLLLCKEKALVLTFISDIC
jgi:hypothetical protein